MVFEAGASSPHRINNSSVFRKTDLELCCARPRNVYDEWQDVDSDCVNIVNKRIDYDRKGLERILDELQAPFHWRFYFLT